MSRTAVIIPLYNHEAFIGEAINSVLAQTKPPKRLIVIDDGSSDGSVAAAREALKNAPKAVAADLAEQPNAGAHAALNRGVGMAKDCDIIAILNSDDRFLPGRLEKAASVLKKHPCANLLCTGLRLIGGDGAALPADEPRAKWFDAVWSLGAAFERGELSLPEWLGIANFPATTSNFIARRAWLEAHPFRGYRYAHDYFALLTAAVEGALVIEPEVELEYRVHSANTITTAPAKLMAEMLRMILDLSASLAPLLKTSPEARARWAACRRAMWSNVSGFRQDLFHSVTSDLLSGLSPETVAKAVESWAASNPPELAEFPNKPLVNLREPGGELGKCSALAERLQALQKERDSLKAQVRALKEEVKSLSRLEESRWVGIGRALGLLRRI